jgi:hypothetical protein
MLEESEPAPAGWESEPLEDFGPADLEPFEDWTADRYMRHPLSRFA